ncbi:phage minor capsid protein [Mycetocola miduiensis]|uniref:Phage minor capsid protein 2 n=1 Tax=Mycetocola miduiensis TaxID=995034 RepID=A0A1I5AVU3_9MICO|nr:phage minor capsid protein [Mycetocola miduiensis]SFN66339.1 Phage minor capsid protein 2 [Mycetocola miduiensis]
MALYVPDPDISTPDLIDDLGRVLAGRYMNAEDELIREIAQRAYRDIELQARLADAAEDRVQGYAYAIQRNRELAKLAGERAKSIRELQALAIQVVGRLRDENLAEELIRVAAEQGEAEAAARLSLARRLPATTTLNGTASQAVAQVTLSLQSRLEALNQRITRFPQDAYQHIVSLTSPNVLLGTSTKMLAQRQAVQNFLADGITGFVDKADRRWRIGTYAEMAGRTSVARAFNDAGVWRMQQSGINLVTIQGGLASCAKCAPWVGKILSTDGSTGTILLPHATLNETIPVTIVGTTDEARSAGLWHPNCSHRATAYLPGLSIPQAGFEYSEEADKARERQRDLEVQIRSAKRKADVAGDPVTRRRELNKVKGKQQELRDHLAATGRKRNSAREQLHFAGN